MSVKKLFTALFMPIVLISCVPAGVTNSTILTSTPTKAVIASATSSLVSPQVVGTQAWLSPQPYQDVRSQDLRQFGDLGDSLIKTLWFDETTIWSLQDEKVARNILMEGMNPGLGIRALHAEGITGNGINVAIIDQNMTLEHPEFQGKVVKYYDVGNQATKMSSMHGPAVTSLLVGNNIGTAPGARVYFVAVPSWLLDAQFYADAIDWIIKENKELPEEDKIRVVSVSAAPSGIWSPFIKNTAAWDDAYRKATAAGILVLDCTYEHGITVPCTYDLNDPDNFRKCIPNWMGPAASPHNRINVPVSRTTATEQNGSNFFSYQFTGNGGLSWSVPYVAGVLAMGWQINPKLTNAQILDMLFASAYVTDNNSRIINPKAFIRPLAKVMVQT